jgi:hypothetical protein
LEKQWIPPKNRGFAKISISTPYFAYLPEICKTCVILAAYFFFRNGSIAPASASK